MSLENRLVVAVAYDRLCMFEFAVAVELFGLERPELSVDWYEFKVVALSNGPLAAMGGMSVTVDAGLEEIEAAGTVIVPGWANRHEPPPQVLIDHLVAAHDRGARLVSICSGVFVLAATGLLDGAMATTHWRYVDELRQKHPAIDVQPDVLYVDNGSVLTSAGSAAGIDLGLHLIRRDFGPHIANEVARRMVVPAHRDGGQAQFIPQPVAHQDDRSVSRTLAWALAQIGTPVTVKALADHAHMSERTFSRRFIEATGTTPHRWLISNRVRLAQDLLETTTLSIDRVANESGLGSAANLRHHFNRQVHTTPSQYRRAFLSQA